MLKALIKERMKAETRLERHLRKIQVVDDERQVLVEEGRPLQQALALTKANIAAHMHALEQEILGR